jgi:hypothetical protein
MKHIDAQWQRRVTKRPELDGFEVSHLASHCPDRTAVRVTLQANRQAGNRHYRVVEELALDIAVDHPVFLQTLDGLEERLADAVKEYEAANPVVQP